MCIQLLSKCVEREREREREREFGENLEVLTSEPCTVLSFFCAAGRLFGPTGSCHTSSLQPSEFHPENH